MGTVKNLPGSLERFSSLEYSNAQSFQNLSDNLSRFWKNKNLSKIRKSFQTSIFCGLAGVEIFPKIFPRACERRRARNYMEKYIPIGDIYFSNVIRFGKIESFQIPTAKNCDASPHTPCGAARCNSSAGEGGAKEAAKKTRQKNKESISVLANRWGRIGAEWMCVGVFF